MKSYTITLTGKHKEIYFKETVKADSKQAAWDMAKDRIIKAICKKGQGDIEIKEG